MINKNLSGECVLWLMIWRMLAVFYFFFFFFGLGCKLLIRRWLILHQLPSNRRCSAEIHWFKDLGLCTDIHPVLWTGYVMHMHLPVRLRTSPWGASCMLLAFVWKACGKAFSFQLLSPPLLWTHLMCFIFNFHFNSLEGFHYCFQRLT